MVNAIRAEKVARGYMSGMYDDLQNIYDSGKVRKQRKGGILLKKAIA